ncbi:hypothetical protein ElyMa_000887100 [Elysia marginata]|uniref:Uncharacterized protein n=1 Tax=Elysia marginata TaxID=1093978 RepID=A0AAV4H6Z2_9GAST|nr:hypothetical protein ElyMa_000887100 [Elysia marginata]
MTRALNRECDPVEFRSHLHLQLTEEDNDRMYICSARDGNEAEYRANETISICPSAAVEDMSMSLQPYDQNNKYTAGTHLTLICVVIVSTDE